MSKPSTKIDLIRHGEPEGGPAYRGFTDDPLSELGWGQMREAVGDHHPWDVIVTSPLLRCAEFAREVAQRHNIPLETDDRFKEIFFGPWEGKTAAEIAAEDNTALELFWSNPVENMPVGAETMQQFQMRVIPAWDEMLSRHTGKHLLLVGHGGMMRLILSHLLEMPMHNMFR
ncbi:MAG: histidine phosphatase family protein, partial [Gammaproteobacteria bacterium]|nr:histidine phosphatase family protein [Gammaproteobacteria bacterium]